MLVSAPVFADYTMVIPQKVGGGTSVWASIVAKELEKQLDDDLFKDSNEFANKNTKIKPNIKNASIDEDDINIDNVFNDIGYGPYKPQVKTNPKDNYLKNKNFPEVRKWVVSNLDNDPGVVLRRVYDACYDCLSPQSIPAAVLIVAKYQYQICFVADQEINLLAALTEIMCECSFK